MKKLTNCPLIHNLKFHIVLVGIVEILAALVACSAMTH